MNTEEEIMAAVNKIEQAVIDLDTMFSENKFDLNKLLSIRHVLLQHRNTLITLATR